MQNAALTPAEIDQAFAGKIKPPRVGFFYTLGLFLVTAVMAILPLIYLAFIVLVIYGTYYHAVHNHGILTGPGRGGRVVIFKFVIYATPIFMGSILAFFMVKPLLARRLPPHQPYALNPEAEPALYEFIRKICEQVGAPMPSLIELDSEVNAAAGFRRGFHSFFSNELTLHIGLSLLAGLSAREFAGVVAHEFGHFTQALAMRLGYIIDRIDGWFARVIYERDSWDAWLEEMAEEAENGYVAVMVGFARLGVWFSRLILKGLLLFGHSISCFLSRQMEFHADQFSIRLAGSAAHESMLHRLDELNALSAASFKQIRVSWNLNKRLPDNLPQFVVNQARTELGAQIRNALKGNLGSVKTGWFDTHPSHADRAREARLTSAPGILNLDRPATDLFQNFPAVSRIVSQLYYQDVELPLAMAKIYEVDLPEPSATPADSPDAPDLGPAAIDRFLFGVVSPLRPIYPKPRPLSDAEKASALSTIQALPQQVNQISDQVASACAAFDAADQKMLNAAAENTDPTSPRDEREQARRSLRAVLQACEDRLSLALSLESGHQPKSEHLASLAPAFDQLDTLRIANACFTSNPDDPTRAAQLQEVIANIEAILKEIPCPWPQGQGSNLFDFARAGQEGAPTLSDWAQALANIVSAAYLCLLGELTIAAEKAIENPQPKRSIRIGSPVAAA